MSKTYLHRPNRLVRMSLAGMVGCVGASIAGCHSPSPYTPVPYTAEDWTYRGAKGSECTSAHYIVRTTCKSKPFVDALPGFLESCYLAYSELLPAPSGSERPLETYLFQTRWQWERFTEEFAGPRAETYKQIRSGGYSERGVTVSHYGSRRSTLSILAHEGLHQYLDATHGPSIPAWINEGLACYFESFDLDEEGRPVFNPRQNTLRTPALRKQFSNKSMKPLKELLGTNAGREIHNPTQQVLGCYSQWWSLIVFLQRPPRENPYHAGFQELLRELGSESMDRKAQAFMAADTDGTMTFGEAVFRAYVTDDLEKFEAEYEAFLPELLSLMVS
ncbi:MAG TPA: DUF1570 domain-containing protein [Phycisphaerae bacterium]|nr:DUF1570 domain-containing protein [Phycisphaerae bacterium]